MSIERFNKYVVYKPNGCHEWIGSKTQRGHGMFSYKGKSMGAHRFILQYLGHAIDNAVICHRCNNPCCVNPDHLYVGTHKTNANDRKNDPNDGYRSNKGTCKKIMTPAGLFYSRKSAAAYYGITPPSLGDRMKHNPTEYYYC